ncbi:DUF177 domain-containing protein [Variovorax defluvii]|uniref:Large ribosomal RNA subunit accumulation protein YceD n=1 Tax=Variovorax defluvii TaxID=913761 RepID=A0ABP8GRI8_9BURK
MTREFTAGRLDVRRLAEAAATLSGEDALSTYARLSAELAAPAGDARVRFKATGASRDDPAGHPVPWLHLTAGATLTLVCQRCLLPVDVPLQVDRWFRFVADEDTAAAEDEEAEEDVLVATRDFDLHALIEDELLMEIPVTPRHGNCPQPVQLSAVDPDFEAAEAARPNPFAALEKLRSDKSG